MYLWLIIDVCSSLTHIILTLAKQKMAKQNEESDLRPLLKLACTLLATAPGLYQLSAFKRSFLTHCPTSMGLWQQGKLPGTHCDYQV